MQFEFTSGSPPIVNSFQARFHLTTPHQTQNPGHGPKPTPRFLKQRELHLWSPQALLSHYHLAVFSQIGQLSNSLSPDVFSETERGFISVSSLHEHDLPKRLHYLMPSGSEANCQKAQKHLQGMVAGTTRIDMLGFIGGYASW